MRDGRFPPHDAKPEPPGRAPVQPLAGNNRAPRRGASPESKAAALTADDDGLAPPDDRRAGPFAPPPPPPGADARIDAALAARGSKTSGSSDAHFWPTPSALWRDEAYARTWYAHAKRYWDDAVVAPATLDGVLGGFAQLDAPDAAWSRRFLRSLDLPWLPPDDAAGFADDDAAGFAAADVAAGIGRVAARVLLPLGARRVDVVEQSASLLRAAPDFIDACGRRARAAESPHRGPDDGADDAPPASSRCRFFCIAMQSWRPRPRDLDVVWVQWSVGHFTDADFVAFLATCRAALKPHGVLVVKDNVLGTSATADDAFYVDDDDRSVCRSLPYYRVIFDLAQATVLAERQQPVAAAPPPSTSSEGGAEAAEEAFPADIYPVFAWALAWPQDWDESMATGDAVAEHAQEAPLGGGGPSVPPPPPPPDANLRGLGDSNVPHN
mmetsp:Transcript_1641/g.6324  ORF Transcript_1641/g.6324 Transcript_1641/m.6324 type:complete len:439 (-) Transcript_1641:23-1339(-)